MASFPRVSPLEPCAHLSHPPYTPHAPPTSFDSRSLLSISFGVTGKGALPPGSHHRAPSERDAPFLEPSFIHLTMSPVYEPPSRFPSGAPLERDACLQSLPLHTFRGPQRGPFGERCLSPEPSFTHLPGSPVLQVPLTELPQKDAPPLEPR